MWEHKRGYKSWKRVHTLRIYTRLRCDVGEGPSNYFQTMTKSIYIYIYIYSDIYILKNAIIFLSFWKEVHLLKRK